MVIPARFWRVTVGILLVAVVCILVRHWPELASAQQRSSASERRPQVLDRAPARMIADPNPVFRAVVLDAEHGEVFMANDKESAGTSVLVYPTQFPATNRIMEPKRRIAGPKTDLGMVCGLALSIEHGELYSVSGETGTLNVYSLDSTGNVGPARRLRGVMPRASAGVFLDVKNDELFITTEHVNRISVYPRTFQEDQEPVRFIQGAATGLGDPHGIYVDSAANEIFVSNHGNWRETQPGEGEVRGPDSLTRTSLGYNVPGRVVPLIPSTGKFMGPSITVHSRSASGNTPPLRIIHGPHTQLSLPDGIYRDPMSGELIVANTGDDSVLFFAKDATGDVAPVRLLKGPATKIKGPVGAIIDAKRNELWVASWDSHVAAVFPRMANGNIAPLRVIRTAPENAPLASMGRIGAVAYDPKRKEILAPNWVSQPRISAYASSADGNAQPTRVIQGPKTLQARTSHYIAVDSVHDELAVPNPFAQAILVFRGGAIGNEAPLRVIQGSKTLLSSVDNVAVDPVHRELMTASFPNDSVLVFRADANGDVAPIRILQGPKTQLDRPIRVEVDPINNLIAVMNDRAILVFNRTDSGDVAPKWVLSGPKTGIGTRNGTRDLKLFPEGRKIIAGGSIRPPRGTRASEPAGEDEQGFFRAGQRFIGVWKYGDTGDIAPWALLNYSPVTKIPGSRMALNTEGGDLIIGGDGKVAVYHLPEIFQKND